MRTETIRESQETLLELESDDAEALALAGQRLASKKSWWGEVQEEGEEPEQAERTVVRVRPAAAGRWWVRVSDAVGVLSTANVQIVVEPKIPMSHFMFLLSVSGKFPRLDPQRASVERSSSMWDLVAAWFVESTELLLRRDLLRDYSERWAELEAAQGHIDLPATTQAYFAGRMAIACSYDEFDFDTPLNRILKESARAVAGSIRLDPLLRRRALRLLARMDEVSEMRPSDLRATIERRSGHYSDAISLARHILQHQGRALSHGSDLAWAFLIRTPDLVEEGILRVLQRGIPGISIGRQKLPLPGSKLTFNPDLVFGSAAVGDVKYKLSSGDWNRGDLYQVVAFAEAFHREASAIVRFRSPQVAPLPEVIVGDIAIREFTWLVQEGISAEDSAEQLANDVRMWLEAGTSAVIAA